MPKLLNHQSGVTTKMLLIGDSGSGKTGALASLAASGYHLRILDLDNGLDVLKNLLTDPASEYVKAAPDCAANVDFITITDQMKARGGRLAPAKATVWSRAMDQLANWDDGEGTTLGPITSWGPQDILVVDSLTMISQAALNLVLSFNGRLGAQPFQSDWGEGQRLVENLLAMLYDEGVHCNVIVCAHVTYIEPESGTVQGYPNTLGKALPPRVGRYFNSILMAQSRGRGENRKRTIVTNTTGLVELKNTAPTRVPASYDLSWGLAEYFKAVRGGSNE